MQLKPGMWVLVRALVIVCFGACAFGDMMSSVHLRPAVLGLIFGFGILQTRVGLLEAYRRLPVGAVWYTPSWRLSPWQLAQPFQFTHLAGYALAACGFAAELREVVQRGTLPDEIPVEMLAGSWGLGLLIGIEWAVRAYPQSFKAAPPLVAGVRGHSSMEETK